MVERPILFNGEMVRAILDGCKTQTRRVVRPQPFHNWTLATVLADGRAVFDELHGYDVHYVSCPYGVPGDMLWVRETWADPSGEQIPIYRADSATAYKNIKWRPSFLMPRWASRLTLCVTDVRVERVQDISEEDAKAEGVVLEGLYASRPYTFREGPPIEYSDGHFEHTAYRDMFRGLWDATYAKRGHGWNVNPWVWVVEFERRRDD